MIQHDEFMLPIRGFVWSCQLIPIYSEKKVVQNLYHPCQKMPPNVLTSAAAFIYSLPLPQRSTEIRVQTPYSTYGMWTWCSVRRRNVDQVVSVKGSCTSNGSNLCSGSCSCPGRERWWSEELDSPGPRLFLDVGREQMEGGKNRVKI